MEEKENRSNVRYKEIGHFLAPDLCMLPGIIDDVSLEGCKVHYQFPVTVELSNEYDCQLSPSQNPSENPLHLKCVPQWVKDTGDKTEIGFKIMYSPDGNKLSDFIDQLKQKNQDDLPEIV